MYGENFRNSIPLKTKVYKYFKDKLMEKEADRRSLKIIDVENKSFATWEMKMLYFTCLLSVKNCDRGLFEIFDDFIAFPNGPLDVDAYNILKNDKDQIGDNNLFIEYIEKSKPVTKKYSEKEISKQDIYEKSINDALDELYNLTNINCHFSPDFEDPNQTKYLIELSHNLKLWRSAINTETKRLDIENYELLVKERDELKKYVK